MDDKRGLSYDAYGGGKGEDYVPYIAANKVLPEFTILSLIIGALLAILFGAANTYLGLLVGMTVSASIPAAVLATGILKGLFKRSSILESNIVQAVASSGESIAGGIIFTIPALLLWGMSVSITQIVLVSLLGGALGILFVVPLRNYLTVEEHGKLIYPEGMACAEVLVAGDVGGSGASIVFTGIGVGAVYKGLSGGTGLWGENPEWAIAGFKGGMIGFNALASLLGVGFIVGAEVGAFMLAGGLVAWMILIPLISYFGAGLTSPIFPSTVPISQMDSWAIWSKYIRYIGAGAVATGGFISLIKSLPTIVRSFRAAMGGLAKSGGKGGVVRTAKDVSVSIVLLGIFVVFLTLLFLPQVPVGFTGAILVVVFGFFFATVSARIVGSVGVSNNPVSGMTIATLLFTSATLKAIGVVGDPGMITAISIGAVVCVAISIAGAGAQNAKTAHIIGATPKYVSYAMYVGVVACAAAVGGVILMLHQTYGMGSQTLAAPQATLMSLVIKGVITGTLPWTLVIVGAVFGVAIYLMGLPILPFALGLYLPIHLSAGIMVGGVVRAIVDRTLKGEVLKQKIERGVLLASGLIAGDALIGIVIAIFAYLKLDITVFGKNPLASNNWFSLTMFIVLAIFTYFYVLSGKNKQDSTLQNTK
jgi:putative OPT family oligopeptide transporter